MERKVNIILIVLFMVAISFFRESFFKSVNLLLDYPDWKESLDNSIFKFLSNFSSIQLKWIKWIATSLFILVFSIFTFLLCKQLFPTYNSTTVILISFTGVFIISLISILIGVLIPTLQQTTYYFSRWLAGAAQSPILPALICLIIYYQHKLIK